MSVELAEVGLLLVLLGAGYLLLFESFNMASVLASPLDRSCSNPRPRDSGVAFDRLQVAAASGQAVAAVCGGLVDSEVGVARQAAVEFGGLQKTASGQRGELVRPQAHRCGVGSGHSPPSWKGGGVFDYVKEKNVKDWFSKKRMTRTSSKKKKQRKRCLGGAEVKKKRNMCRAKWKKRN